MKMECFEQRDSVKMCPGAAKNHRTGLSKSKVYEEQVNSVIAHLRPPSIPPAPYHI